MVTFFEAEVLADEEQTKDLTSLDLEQLLDVEVTIVSKTEERLTDAAAAVTVITGEDIRRSGATSFPEALRGTPGFHVSQVTSSIWEVSSRGFSSPSSAKLLVMMDGRSLYTPLFSGVFWDVQDMILADVDRIEVVRGPGGTLWGADAMNGVVNILSKKAQDTQGAYVEAGGGTALQAFAGVRYGGRAGDNVFYRVYGKAFDRAGGFEDSGASDDGWRMGRIGFRVDANLAAGDSFSLQGDGYVGEVGEVVPALSLTGRPAPPPPLSTDVAGGNLYATYQHRWGKGADVTVRAYYDRTHRDDPTYRDDLDTFDVDLQSRAHLPGPQELVWGASYRLMNDAFQGKGIADFQPGTSLDNLFTGFVQDTAFLLHGSLRLTLGTKLEHNDFSGFELQPGARVAWDPAAGQTLWAAASRSVRVPTRLERDITGDVGPTTGSPVIRIVPNRDLSSEVMVSAELGYRVRPTPRLFVDLAGFYFRYDGLITFEVGTPFMDNGQTVVPVADQNTVHGQSFGGEAEITWTPLPSWKLVGSYSYLEIELEKEQMDVGNVEQFEGASPQHQVAARSLLNLPGRLQLDVFVRWVDGFPTGAGGASNPDYVEADARLGWQPWKNVDISVVGQSLLHDHHSEFPGGSQVPRSVYGRLSGRF